MATVMTRSTTDATEAVRLHVERTLAEEQVNLTSEEGRERTADIIEQAIRNRPKTMGGLAGVM